MSFELVVTLTISAIIIFLAYMSINSKLQKHLRTLFLFMTLFLMIILINEAMLLARDASAGTPITNLLSTIHVVLIWTFTFLTATTAIIEASSYFKNGKISLEKDTYRTR